MKRVSFNVAKAIKEAGYPQEKLTDKVYLVNCYKEGKLARYNCALYYDCAVAPTYLEVWLWLWREKRISVMIAQNEDDMWEADVWYGKKYIATNDPEEALIAAIEYLVDNDLIKQ